MGTLFSVDNKSPALKRALNRQTEYQAESWLANLEHNKQDIEEALEELPLLDKHVLICLSEKLDAKQKTLLEGSEDALLYKTIQENIKTQLEKPDTACTP